MFSTEMRFPWRDFANTIVISLQLALHYPQRISIASYSRWVNQSIISDHSSHIIWSIPKASLEPGWPYLKEFWDRLEKSGAPVEWNPLFPYPLPSFHHLAFRIFDFPVWPACCIIHMTEGTTIINNAFNIFLFSIYVSNPFTAFFCFLQFPTLSYLFLSSL